jgi:hypothetical protein
MFKTIAGVVALATAGSVGWGATQGVSVGEIIHGIEHLAIVKADTSNTPGLTLGGWTLTVKDDGDEVGFVKATHDELIFSQLTAAELLQMGHKSCEWLHDGSGPNDIINRIEQKTPPPPGVPLVLLHKAELDLITNSQVYLCPDTLHNGAVSTPTPATTVAPSGPTTMVATTAPYPPHQTL